MSENAGSASLHERYVLDSQMIVVLALGVPWMQRAERARKKFFAQKAQKPQNGRKTRLPLKSLKS